MSDVEDLTRSVGDLRKGQGLTVTSLTAARHPVLMHHLGTDDPFEGVEILSNLARKLGNTREAKVLRYVMAIDVEDRGKNASARRRALIEYGEARDPLIPVSERTLFSDENKAIDQLVQLVLRYSKTRESNGMLERTQWLPNEDESVAIDNLSTEEADDSASQPPQSSSKELMVYDPEFAKRQARAYLLALKSWEWPHWAHDEPSYADMDASLYKQRYGKDGNPRLLSPPDYFGPVAEMELVDEDQDWELRKDWLNRLLDLKGSISNWVDDFLEDWGDVIQKGAAIVIIAILALALLGYGEQESDHFFHTHFLKK